MISGTIFDSADKIVNEGDGSPVNDKFDSIIHVLSVAVDIANVSVSSQSMVEHRKPLGKEHKSRFKCM